MPEPSSPLWAAVKVVHDSWPPDDEAVARAVGGAWRRGGDVVAQGGRDTAAASALAMWPDAAGVAFQGHVDRYARTVGQVEQRMLGLAAQGEHYAGELESAKHTITATIAANEEIYALLGSPMLGPLGPALQADFAVLIANHLQGMVAEKAAALRANPAGAPVPAQLPPPPPPPEEWSPLDGLADGVRALGQFDQAVAQWSGEVYGGAVDLAGQLGAGVVGWAGDVTGQDFAPVADGFRAVASAVGNGVEEGYLALGAYSQDIANDAATVIDGDKVPHIVIIDASRYPESANHIDSAQGGISYRGDESTAYEKFQQRVLTLDRDGAKDNRAASLRGVPSAPAGYDRDEYPPAVFEEGGAGSSVLNIPRSDNRGAGSSMGHQLNHMLIGTAEDSVERQTVRLEDNETVIIVTRG